MIQIYRVPHWDADHQRTEVPGNAAHKLLRPQARQLGIVLQRRFERHVDCRAEDAVARALVAG